MANNDIILNSIYIISALCFIIGLKLLSSPERAKKGNALSAVGMLIAVVATILIKTEVNLTWVIAGMFIGSLIGASFARLVVITAMPQMVAMFNGFGGLASLLVGYASYTMDVHTTNFKGLVVVLSILIGGVTFSGSLVAWGKLAGKIKSSPILFPGLRLINITLLMLILYTSFITISHNDSSFLTITVLLTLLLGFLTVIPIGGADMPVVISLLNSYSGLAASTVGFVISNVLLIITGALVGASGFILTTIMCKAMNRSLVNVLFGSFMKTKAAGTGGKVEGEIKPINVEDGYLILERASSVLIVPGYGLAVAQAQHVVKELSDALERHNCDVRFAVHPVAGRMPGHMNVLLAEANIAYDKLFEMDDVNSIMDTIDVCIVIGANDVVNPAARLEKTSPIYGMPIINADKAKVVFVLKRSMATGFAGIENPLFHKVNTRMLFGNAKKTVGELVALFKG